MTQPEQHAIRMIIKPLHASDKAQKVEEMRRVAEKINLLSQVDTQIKQNSLSIEVVQEMNTSKEEASLFG